MRALVRKPDVWFAVLHAEARAAVHAAHPDNGGTWDGFYKAVRVYDDFVDRWQYHANHARCARPSCRTPFTREHRARGRVQRFCSPRCANIVNCARARWLKRALAGDTVERSPREREAVAVLMGAKG